MPGGSSGSWDGSTHGPGREGLGVGVPDGVAVALPVGVPDGVGRGPGLPGAVVPGGVVGFEGVAGISGSEGGGLLPAGGVPAASITVGSPALDLTLEWGFELVGPSSECIRLWATNSPPMTSAVRSPATTRIAPIERPPRRGPALPTAGGGPKACGAPCCG